MELFNIMNRIYWLSYQDGPAAYCNFMKSHTHMEKNVLNAQKCFIYIKQD